MHIFELEHILPCVLLGFLLDLILGDPRWLYHPVRLIGKLITWFENLFRTIYKKGKKEEHYAGFCTVVCVTLISTLVPFFLLKILYFFSFPLGFLLETFWCYQLLATRSLKDESMKVYKEVKKEDLEKARKAVSMIVGRDTQVLDMEGVTKAAVETVAENTSDGIVAPLLFMMLGGAAGGFFYKAVNTMDSMIGYKNDRYRYFGTVAAKLDDLLNLIPARLGGMLMCLMAGVGGFDGANAWKIFKRDRRKHASPNSAHTEAATAGALDVQLAGDAWYFGKLHKKPFIGDPIRPVDAEDIPKANHLALLTGIASLVLFGLIRLILVLILK